MEMKKLDFAETLKDSIAIGVKNAPSVVVAVALWLVTIWIPYINIGTTIAISLLPVELAKGLSLIHIYFEGRRTGYRRGLRGAETLRADGEVS